MKYILIALLSFFSLTLHADTIFVNSVYVTNVMAYAKDDHYSDESCVIDISQSFSSQYPSNQRFVARLGSAVVERMCDLATTALLENKAVDISSNDSICDNNQGSPYARYLTLVK